MSNSDTKVLLLIGGAVYHDQPSHRETFRQMLGSRFDVTVTGYPQRTLTAENLAEFDVIADYSSWWEVSREHYLPILQAVIGGTIGYAGLHVSDSFVNPCRETWPGFHDMTGASFVYHDPNKLFDVTFEEKNHYKTGDPLLEKHPITEGIEDFEVQDELFVVHGDKTKWHVLARAEGHPVAWTKPYGKGRVFCTVLGHDYRSLGTPGIEALYVQGIEWAAGLR